MSLAILHISDIHFREGPNRVAERADKIAATLDNLPPDVEACLIAVTGDIAFSGKAREYGAAKTFFHELQKALAARRPTVLQALFCVPGNHDCDHDLSDDARLLALDTPVERLERLEADGTVVTQCLAVQQHFSDFQAHFCDPELRASRSPLLYCRDVEVGDKHCCPN